MKRHGVPVNDLHAITKEFGPESFSQLGEVHSSCAGYGEIAEPVVTLSVKAIDGQSKE